MHSRAILNACAAPRLLSFVAGVVCLVAVAGSSAAQDSPPASSSERPGAVYKVAVDDIIHRVSAQYIGSAIDRAAAESASLVLIELQTPGGLDTAMREIIEKIFGSEVPVVVYVAPSGARAASAGFLIALAADVAAMAPGTNMGAAHPVAGSGQPLDETMSKKLESDAAAYVRSIAEQRGRPVELAEKGVVESQSWTEVEALDAGLIDYVAVSEEELLRELDGTTVKRFDGSEAVLRTSGEVVLIEMSIPQRILSIASHPNIAYILLSLGFLGLYFELSNPGAIIPGVTGVISLVLAFLALQVLPVNFAGLLLLVLGLGLLIAEALTPAFGALGLGGIVSFLLGSLILFEEQTIPTTALNVSLSVVLPVALTLAGMFFFLTRLVLQAQKRVPTTGREGMLGAEGRAETEIGEVGKIFIHGEYWNARSPQTIAAGEKVRVTSVEGLVLLVERASDS